MGNMIPERCVSLDQITTYENPRFHQISGHCWRGHQFIGLSVYKAAFVATASIFASTIAAAAAPAFGARFRTRFTSGHYRWI